MSALGILLINKLFWEYAFFSFFYQKESVRARISACTTGGQINVSRYATEHDGHGHLERSGSSSITALLYERRSSCSGHTYRVEAPVGHHAVDQKFLEIMFVFYSADA